MRRLPLLHLSLIFLCMLPATMIVPVLKDIIKDRLGGSNATVSFFVSIAMLGAFLFGPVAGYISDRMRKRSSLIAVGALLDAICFFGMVQVGEIWLLLLIRFMEGAVSITVIGLLLAAITDRENDSSNPVFFQKGILMGLAGLLLSLGVGLGLPLGILGQTDPRLPFYIAALLMLVTGILALQLPESESIHTSRGQLSRLSVALRERPLILIPFAFAFVDRFTVGFLVSAFNLHLRESLAFGPG
ncbi:MAG: MFS transporter, partial [Leptospiraceae bacterium]|nr:MFS transporter [Leptospiraceae bacterium]